MYESPSSRFWFFWSRKIKWGFEGKELVVIPWAWRAFIWQIPWDERAASLEEQVLQPIQDEVEMGLTINDLERIVSEQAYYPPLFEAAFGSETISSERIGLALAQFVRSLRALRQKA